MEKSPDAFRTISEVAEELDLPQHVLRFWETKFPQIRPLKRGGGRRYYRPDDVELLRGIRHLLYGEGYTIRGVQRILKEDGPRYVQAILHEAMGEVEGDEPDAPASVRGEHRPSEGKAEGRSGLGGFFGLLPGRGKSAPAGASDDEPDDADDERLRPEPYLSEPAQGRRPVRRRGPDDAQDYPQLPLLPDFDPPRPVPLHHAPPPASPRGEADDPLPAFPFRSFGPERAPVEPEWPQPEFAPPPPVPREPQMLPRETQVSSRVTAFRPVEEAGPAGLTPEQVHLLEGALYDLQECWRLLDEARRDGPSDGF